MGRARTEPDRKEVNPPGPGTEEKIQQYQKQKKLYVSYMKVIKQEESKTH
jgi:hypothetical protein